MEKEYDEVQMMKEKKPNTETSVLTSEEREKIIENATTVGDNFAWEEGVEVARKVFINSLIWHTEQAVLAKCRAEMDALRKEKDNLKEKLAIDDSWISKQDMRLAQKDAEIAELKRELRK